LHQSRLVYSFVTKDGLVRAALEREVSRFQDAVRQRLGDKPVDPFEMVLAHIEEALDEDDATTRKAAFLVTGADSSGGDEPSGPASADLRAAQQCGSRASVRNQPARS
jgi:AcrR family transcriptional regulator